jgi:MFS family permease
VLGLVSIVFVPFFFFGSVYAQVSLGETASNAGLYIAYFFLGFVVMAQIGGRILDKRGARPAVVMGTALGAVGFYLLAGKLSDLSLGDQWPYIALAGGGVGLMLGTASTDAVNRARATARSPASPRRRGTSARASASPCSARSSSARRRRTSPTR